MKPIITLTVALWASATGAQPFACSNGVVTVETTDPALAQLVCTHTDRTLAQFRSCNLPPPPAPLLIQTVDTLIHDCIGLYHCGKNWIEVLTPDVLEVARLDQTLFAHVPTDRLFASVIHHEMAHALFDTAPCPYDNCRATSEYFAYTQQISALDDDDRAPIDAGIADFAPVPDEAVNPVILMLSPDHFTLNAWAHFSARADGCANWRAVLDGTVAFDFPDP